HFLTRFFDREEEIERLVAMLAPSGVRSSVFGIRTEDMDTEVRTPNTEHRTRHARLVTLTGSGGSGKTRLAVEAARRLVEPFQGRIWFVPLADLTDGRLVLERILAGLRLPPAPDQ